MELQEALEIYRETARRANLVGVCTRSPAHRQYYEREKTDFLAYIDSLLKGRESVAEAVLTVAAADADPANIRPDSPANLIAAMVDHAGYPDGVTWGRQKFFALIPILLDRGEAQTAEQTLFRINKLVRDHDLGDGDKKLCYSFELDIARCHLVKDPVRTLEDNLFYEFSRKTKDPDLLLAAFDIQVEAARRVICIDPLKSAERIYGTRSNAERGLKIKFHEDAEARVTGDTVFLPADRYEAAADVHLDAADACLDKEDGWGKPAQRIVDNFRWIRPLQDRILSEEVASPRLKAKAAALAARFMESEIVLAVTHAAALAAARKLTILLPEKFTAAATLPAQVKQAEQERDRVLEERERTLALSAKFSRQAAETKARGATAPAAETAFTDPAPS